MFSDVATVNGQPVLVTDAIFAPDPAWYVRVAANGSVWCAISQGPDVVLVRDSMGRSRRFNEPAFGINCVGIEPHEEGWLLIWMQAPNGATYRQVVVSDDLLELSNFIVPSPFGGTSQGFLDINDFGVPIMTDQNVAVVKGGHRISHPTTRGSWTVGDSNDFYGVAAWDESSRRFYKVYDGNVQTCSHLTLVDGSPVVAVANTDRMVTFEEFVPWRAEPVSLPPFPDAPINCFPFDWPGVLNVSDVFAWGTFRYGDATELQKVVASAKARKVPSLGDYDEPSFDLSQLPAALDVVGIQCYPAKDIAADVLVEVARQDIDACRKANRPCVLIVAVYTGSGAWPLDGVRRLLRGLWSLASEYGVDVLPFGNLRPPVQPELIDDLKAMLAAAKGHAPQPTPKPQPSSLELLMGALTLKRSQFKDGSFDPTRKLYPDVTNKDHHLSIDSVTGDPRPGGMPGNGPSESFIVKGDRAVVDFGTHAYTFPVTD